MLVLSRKNRESVVVGGSDGFSRLLKVTVLDIRGGKVRLGFEVDADVPVHRLEVWDRINGNGALDRPAQGPSSPAREDARGLGHRINWQVKSHDR